jgi:hypothetical protein
MQVRAAYCVIKIEEPSTWQCLAPQDLVVLPKSGLDVSGSFADASVLKSNEVSISMHRQFAAYPRAGYRVRPVRNVAVQEVQLVTWAPNPSIKLGQVLAQPDFHSARNAMHRLVRRSVLSGRHGIQKQPPHGREQ